MNINENKDNFSNSGNDTHRSITNGKKNIHLDTLRLKLDILLQELRSSSGILQFLNIIYWALLALLIIVIIISSFVFGSASKIIPVFILVLFIVYKRIRIQRATKVVKNHKLEMNEAISSSNYFLRAKIEYVMKGIQLRIERINLVRIFYLIFFPLFTFYLTELIKGQLPFNSFWTSIVLAYLIAGLPWFLYFRPGIIDLLIKDEELRDQLELLD